MSIPRDHHFIPVFYLKGWVNSDGKLIEYCKKRGKLISKPVGPKATGFERHLYSFPGLPPNIAHALESIFLQKADNLASRALDKLLHQNDGNWSSELRSAWSRFLVNLVIRHPDPFKEVVEAVRNSWLHPDGKTQAEYMRIKRPEDPPTFTEYVAAQGDNLADKIHFKLVQGVLDNGRTGTRINNMLWNVIDLSDSRFSLLTSDWPFDHALGRTPGFATLPIGPRALFLATTDRKSFEAFRRRSADDVVCSVNECVVARARRFVYSVDNQQERFIRNRMSSRMVQRPFFPSLIPSDVALASTGNLTGRSADSGSQSA